MQSRITEHLGRMLTDVTVSSRKEFKKEVRFYKKQGFQVVTRSKDFICLDRDFETVRIIVIKGR